MAKVLYLYASQDECDSKRLKNILQTKLGDGYNISTVKDIVVEGSNLGDGLSQAGCVVLILSSHSLEHIVKGTVEKEDGVILFDGRLLQEKMKAENLQRKLVIIKFASASSVRVPDGVDTTKVFLVDEKFDKQTPLLDMVVDTIKGIVNTKSSSSSNEKEKKSKKTCSQM